MTPTNLVSIAILALLVFWAVGAYNRMIRLKNVIANAFGQIDVQLKRRYDLIPNLIETVKGYAAHERETLDAVTQARTTATQTHIDAGAVTAEQMAAMSGAEASLSGALGKLIAISENYPDLKANTNFAQLQSELADTENKIQAARRFYNGNVRDLNIALQAFPSNIVGNMFNFKAEPFFELPENSEEREVVKVSF